MNYYEPRQRDRDKRWDYTVFNRRTGAHAVGYCRKFPAFTPEQTNTVFHGSQEAHDQYVANLEPFRDKYHTTGHETKQEAYGCYTEYLLDQKLQLGEMGGRKEKCVVCNEWTQGYAEVDRQRFVLCDRHRTRDEVAKIFKAGDSFGSQ